MNLRNIWIIIAIVLLALVVVFVVFSKPGKDGIPQKELESYLKNEGAVDAPSNVDYAREEAQNIIEQPQEKQAAQKEAPEEITKDFFAVQVASFKEKIRAGIVLDGLKKKNYAGYIVSKDLPGKGVFYRVWVGRLKSKEQAQEVLGLLKADYPGCFIIQADNSIVIDG